MTYAYIKSQIMFQTNNDASDLGDFTPAIGDYINQGYDEMLMAFRGVHVGSGDGETKALANDSDVPELPEYAHRALVDFGTYMIYRNGNAVKQQRGNAYYMKYSEILAQLKYERSRAPFQFRNLYTS